MSPRAKAKTVRILALESSCDESAAAVLDSEQGLLAHELFSQVELHRIYGGVVPELASRDHVQKLLPLVRSALSRAGTEPRGPGWGGLHSGARADRSFAYGGRLWRGALRTPGTSQLSLCITWRATCWHPCSRMTPRHSRTLHFLVSGGHTMLIEVQGIGRYELLGETRDDAAGEAFDKTAKLLGLPYPGGPELARMADAATGGAFTFPRPHARPSGPGVQLFGAEDSGIARCARSFCGDERTQV